MLLNHAGNWLRRNYSHGCLHTACLFWCSWVLDFAKLPSLQPTSSCCCCFLLLAPLPFVKTAGNHSFSSGHQIFSVVLLYFSLAVMNTMLISHSGEKRAHHWGGSQGKTFILELEVKPQLNTAHWGLSRLAQLLFLFLDDPGPPV